jgi:hypothetical protein
VNESPTTTPDPRDTPILLIVFRRTDLTKRVFEAIRRHRPKRLFVAADGPRPERGRDEARQCEATRAITELVDWPCHVSRHYATENLGVSRRPNSAIDWAFEHVDRLVVLEDDCLPSPDFFRFCTEMLERFADDARIYSVCGVNLQSPEWTCPASYCFSRYSHSWGWATWRRAWAAQDLQLSRWKQLRSSDWIERYFGRRDEARCWRDILDRACEGRVPAWDYQWNFNNWIHDRFAVHSGRNLVCNIGFGADASNTTIASGIGGIPIQPMEFPLRHPDAIERDVCADRLAFERIYRPWTLAQKLRHRIARIRNLITSRGRAA